MKTTELRLGNLVKYEGKIYQVFSLDPCFVGLCEPGKDELLFDVDVQGLDSVLLTEEVIKSLGENAAYIDSDIISRINSKIQNENIPVNQLAKAIGYPRTNLQAALKNRTRPIPMKYMNRIFGVLQL